MLAPFIVSAIVPLVQDCSQLAPGFGAYGVASGPNGGNVRASVVFDDGQGPALYLGGDFDFAGEILARAIVRFDGTNFQALPGPGGVGVLSSSGVGVRALAVFDDGNGPELYVAGDFDVSLGFPQHGLARWDGAAWTPVLAVTSQFAGFVGISDLEVWNDGSGDALYFGGTFNKVNGSPAASVAKYDGSGWTTLGAGYVGSYLGALAVHDDGSGAKLYAGGWNFPSQQSIECWDGVSWTILPGTFSAPIEALASHDDGSGAKLYAGGTFSSPFQSLARFDGSTWSAVGSSVSFFPTAFATHDDGSGAALYAIGRSYVLPPPAWSIRAARWDGANWQDLGSGLSADSWTLCEFDASSGTELYAGGGFTQAGDKRADHVAKWTSSGWSRVYSSRGLSSTSYALYAFDDGVQRELYADAGLTYLNVQGQANPGGFVRWNGLGWTTLPGKSDGSTFTFAAFDSGAGTELFAGGTFSEIDGLTANGIARFDGAAWHALGGGLTRTGFPGYAYAACVHDFGAGPRLVVGGWFDTAGGVGANNVAVWDGTAWSALDLGTNDPVRALASFDDGSGPKLFAGGDFTAASGAPANYVARWSGSAWQPVLGGMNREVYALATLDCGDGEKLYAGGDFFVAGSAIAPNVAVYDGTSWRGLIDTNGQSLNGRVNTLVVHDEGGGPELYVGGGFSSAGGNTASHVARWDRTHWYALDEEPDSVVHSLAVFDDELGSGPALFAVGSFGTWNGTPSMCVARIAPQAPCAPVVYCTSKVNSLGCTPSMYSTGSTSLAANNFRLHASNVLNNKFGLLFWSTKPNGAPFQGGHLCCKPPIVRTTVQSTTGNPPPSDCSGSLHFHWNQAYVNQLGLALGDWYYTQYWSRDPNSPSTTSLSDAIRFLLTP
ncbi:MAG: hypothetical protein L6Q99_04760 [Planctomycetes bacterium]|nr:hypothetical protein [Planctomycetota bacterium]